jgi:putative ABC transport system substrate-binding protein
MLRRRGFVAGSALLLASMPVRAERSQKFLIGRLSPLSEDTEPPNAAGLRQGLREHGWREGTDYQLVFRFANGDARRLPPLAAELVALGVDILVPGSNAGGLAAKNVTGKIPVVLVTTGDRCRSALSAASPGRAGTSPASRPWAWN